jgi:cathepsin X
VYEYAARSGIPSDSCNSYVAADRTSCSAMWQCYTCSPFVPNNACEPVPSYERLVVAEHGRLSGAADMKAEIMTRGPITCTINATVALDECAAAAFAALQRTTNVSVI